MNKHYDVLVVGAGLSGLLAALFAARAGKKTLVITQGNGALTIGGGTIDVLGYASTGITPLAVSSPASPSLSNGGCISQAALTSPFEGLSRLGAEHPYTLTGEAAMRNALEAFETLCREGGYPYVRNAENNTRVVTAVGTTKPAYLVPKSMYLHGLETAEQVYVVGFEGLKDFHPRLVAQGLSLLKAFAGKTLTPITLASPYGQIEGDKPLRDLSTLDLARYFETPTGESWLFKRLKAKRLQSTLSAKNILLMPPLLGTRPDNALHTRMEQSLGLHVCEVLTPPPAVSGLRLLSLLKSMLKAQGVDIIEQASVTAPLLANGRCTGVITTSSQRQREYSARSVIMATGGIYGEGITVQPHKAFETVFGLALNNDLTPASPAWSSARAFSADAPHGFATLGVRVNAKLNPLGPEGNVLWDNVFFIGRTLGGYDHVTEKSGNGVALVTAHMAATLA